MKLWGKRSPGEPPAGAAPPCPHAGVPRIRGRRYWARSRLWTVKELVCADCGQPLRPARGSGR